MIEDQLSETPDRGMPEYQHNPTNCPQCNKMLDCATPADPSDPEATPGEGCITVCMYCHAILMYEVSAANPELLALVPMTEEMWAEIPSEIQEQINRVRRVLRRMPLPKVEGQEDED
jgi:DNA repair photolyase